MKKILLLSNHKNFLVKEGPKEDVLYNEKLSLLLKKEGYQFIRSSSFEFDFEANSFRQGELFDGEKWSIQEDIVPDKILCYSNEVNFLSSFISKKFTFQNSTDFIHLANNKYITSKVLSRYSPTTYIASEVDISELNKEQDYILKPIGGTGSYGVKKYRGKYMLDGLEAIDSSSTYIIQEFLDGSGGIDGVMEGLHDVRILCFGNKFFPYAYIRRPKKGDFRCALRLGGSGFYVELEKIPTNFLQTAIDIQGYINTKIGAGFYSIDLVSTDEGIRLVEINSSPAFFLECERKKDGNDLFMEYLVDYIKNF